MTKWGDYKYGSICYDKSTEIFALKRRAHVYARDSVYAMR